MSAITQEYKYAYTADASKAIGTTRQLITEIRNLGRALDSINPKLAAFAKNMPGVATAKTNLQGLNTTLARTATNATRATTALNGVSSGAAAVTPPANGAASAVGGLGGNLVGLGAGVMVLSKLKQGLNEVQAAGEAARDFLNLGAEKGLQKREAVREFANLIGHDAPDDQVMMRLFKIGAAGGMLQKEAAEYGTEFRSAAPAGLQRHGYGGGLKAGETQADYEKRNEGLINAVEEEGARFATRIGLDPATGGRLAGLVANYGKVDKVEDAAGQLEGMLTGINMGVGKATVLSRAVLQDAATMIDTSKEEGSEGRVKDLAEMGAIVGVASNNAKSPAAAGTIVTRANRLLRKMAMSDDPEIQKLGLKTDESFTESLRKAAPVLAGPGYAKFLIDHGLRESGENDAAHAFAKDLGILDQRTEIARGRSQDGPGAMRKNATFKDRSITGMNRQGEIQKEQGEYLATMERQRVLAARKAAEGQLQQEKKIDTTGSNVGNALSDALSAPGQAMDMIGNLAAGQDGDEWRTRRQDTIDARVAKNLVDAGKKAGIDMEKRYPGISTGSFGGKTLDKVINEVAPELEAKGVPMIGGEGLKAEVEKMGAAPLPAVGANPAAVGANPAEVEKMGAKVPGVGAGPLAALGLGVGSLPMKPGDAPVPLQSRADGVLVANLPGEGGPGPEIQADPLKEADTRLTSAADALKDAASAIVAALGGGGGRGGARRSSVDIGPPADFSNNGGPIRSGSA